MNTNDEKVSFKDVWTEAYQCFDDGQNGCPKSADRSIFETVRRHLTVSFVIAVVSMMAVGAMLFGIFFFCLDDMKAYAMGYLAATDKEL
jgi:hypothetical protein